MDVIELKDIVTGMLLMLLGAMGSGALWAIKAIFRMRKDIDAAFYKIRNLESKHDGTSSCEAYDGTSLETGF